MKRWIRQQHSSVCNITKSRIYVVTFKGICCSHLRIYFLEKFVNGKIECFTFKLGFLRHYVFNINNVVCSDVVVAFSSLSKSLQSGRWRVVVVRDVVLVWLVYVCTRVSRLLLTCIMHTIHSSISDNSSNSCVAIATIYASVCNFAKISLKWINGGDTTNTW